MYHKRNIAAPFQNQNKISDQIPSSEAKFKVIDGFINFRNFHFPPLECVHHLKFDKYCGPTPESNWVIPGVLLVGAYPASEDDEDTFELISSILKQGVTKFVCLQSEYQAGIPRHIWITGGALRPYYEDVQHIVSLKDTLPEFRGYKIVDSDTVSFDHCPIIDCGVTDDSKVLSLAMKLVKDISEGEVIYLHCWGGHGRTGTVVCIMLHLLYGMSWKEAFEYCQAVHDLRTCPVEVGSPQTQQQRMQVIRVIELLMAEYEDRRVAQETAALQNFHAQLYEQTQQEEHHISTSNSTTTTAAAVTVAAAVVEGTHHSTSTHIRTGAVHTSPTTTNTTSTNTSTSPVKPGIVVRESTQDHITHMNRHQLGMSAAQTASMNAYNNKNLGRKKPNIGTASVENSTLPSIHTNTKMGSKAKNIPISGAKAKNDSTTSNTTSTSVSLLQTLQAHPPRNPPPHHTNRIDMLRTRGLSSQKHPLGAHPYIPHSSDEGENSTAEDDDESFIISQMTSSASLLNQQRTGVDDHMHIPSDGDSGCGTPGGVSYISSSTSCASRPMSVNQPDNSVLYNNETSNCSSNSNILIPVVIAAGPAVEKESSASSKSEQGSMDLSIDGHCDYSNTEGATAITVTGNTDEMLPATTTKESNTKEQLSVAGKTTNHFLKPEAIIITTTTITNTTTTKYENEKYDSSDLDDTIIRPATATGSEGIQKDSTCTATTDVGTTSSESGASGSTKKKTKRLSSAKAITNAFREGIKMLTGGTTSTRNRSSTANSTGSNSNTASVLKTASSDSTVSCSTSLSQSHSNPTTPTHTRHAITTSIANTAANTSTSNNNDHK